MENSASPEDRLTDEIFENQRVDDLAKISLVNREFSEISRALQAGLICEHTSMGHTHRHKLRHKNGQLQPVTIFRFSGMSMAPS